MRKMVVYKYSNTKKHAYVYVSVIKNVLVKREVLINISSCETNSECVQKKTKLINSVYVNTAGCAGTLKV